MNPYRCKCGGNDRYFGCKWKHQAESKRSVTDSGKQEVDECFQHEAFEVGQQERKKRQGGELQGEDNFSLPRLSLAILIYQSLLVWWVNSLIIAVFIIIGR